MDGQYLPSEVTQESRPRTKEELRSMLDDIVLQAFENGVDIDDTAYKLSHKDTTFPDWEVLIMRIVKDAERNL